MAPTFTTIVPSGPSLTNGIVATSEELVVSSTDVGTSNVVGEGAVGEGDVVSVGDTVALGSPDGS